nr:immunoglobulin light chain junction region [Macaca mulatta]MOV67041.1 immunoglobulin light chain junction region [Macaca mulatta]MOV67332.1 immunoglobulin light chain junction region [Macaca mulatta]MOV69157.1 immunoglobulin light chain junction region [Macaca mulatta]MOV69497.1 immunoglobulin light chain junction region [Macaca mulatta]
DYYCQVYDSNAVLF